MIRCCGIIVMILLMTYHRSYALDGSISIEGDITAKETVPDLQAQLGQRWKDWKLFGAAEITRSSELFPNSPRNYRIGVQRDLGAGIVIESGAGDYSDHLYSYVKATWTFDTEGTR